MTAKKVRWGVLGCADIAIRSFIPALIENQEWELVAVASRQRDKGDFVAKKFECKNAGDYLALLDRENIDAVYLPIPNALHARWIIEAAKRGKHVLCEKPLATSYSEVVEAVDVCEKQGVALMEGFAYQHHPQHRKVAEIVQLGRIGHPKLFEASFGFPPPLYSEYRFDKGLGGGALLDAGVYPIHAARKFFAKEPLSVFSCLSSEGSALAKKGSEVNMNGSLLLDFDKGRSAQLSFGYDYSYRNSYSVWGSLGRVVIPNRAFSIPPAYNASIWIETENHREEVVLSPVNCFLEEIKTFCAGLEDPARRRAWVQDILGQAAVVQKSL